MTECFGNSFIRNGILTEASAFDNSLVYEGDSIYEIMRAVNGIPVFFHDHMSRLASSVNYQGKRLLATSGMLKRDILVLAAAEKKKEANIKIVFNYNNERHNYLLYYTEPQYPLAEQYREGVKGILYRAERKDPASKVINHKFRTSVYQKLISENAYEALLVDHLNRITEGSRSNIFFISENKIFTAPEGIILNGISRKYILEVCREISIPVILECANANDLTRYESVFMSGTSPVVLPFSSIDNVRFNTQSDLIIRLRMLFMQKADESLRDFSASQQLL